MVSGATAPLLQQRSTLTPDQVKELLTSTVNRMDGVDAAAQGAGEPRPGQAPPGLRAHGLRPDGPARVVRPHLVGTHVERRLLGLDHVTRFAVMVITRCRERLVTVVERATTSPSCARSRPVIAPLRRGPQWIHAAQNKYCIIPCQASSSASSHARTNRRRLDKCHRLRTDMRALVPRVCHIRPRVRLQLARSWQSTDMQ